jgi:hypothetical protein
MLKPQPLVLDEAGHTLYERFVPLKHPLRQMDEALDFSFVLPLVAYHNCQDCGPRRAPKTGMTLPTLSTLTTL